MESSGLGLILDSSAVIEAERQRLNVARFLKYLADRVGEIGAADTIRQFRYANAAKGHFLLRSIGGRRAAHSLMI